VALFFRNLLLGLRHQLLRDVQQSLVFLLSPNHNGQRLSQEPLVFVFIDQRGIHEFAFLAEFGDCRLTDDPHRWRDPWHSSPMNGNRISARKHWRSSSAAKRRTDGAGGP
jgi:hypothetical protein